MKNKHIENGKFVSDIRLEKRKSVYLHFKQNPNLTGSELGKVFGISTSKALSIVGEGLRGKW